MLSVIHLRVAFVLLAISSAAASPCKPPTTTSAAISATTISTTVTSDASAETSLVTSVASTTEDEVATSSTVVESSTEIFVSSTETSASSAETSDSSITIEISAATTTTEATAENTTAEPTTTDATTTAAETTSSAAIPTFTMLASGPNVVAGRSLQTYNRDGTVAVFDPATDDDNPSVRQYSIDSQGRIVNDLGWFLCGYYGATNDELNKPATVAVCRSETTLQTAFLTCELDGPFAIECSVPAMSCVSSGSTSMPPTCIPTTGYWRLNSVGVRPFGHTWQIGGSDTPDKYERMIMSIREV
ncbi:hypothetical protein FANTH_6465 [Fusarium anthophilum]|uniref:Uncharacterized protein n=1 Tax=Fusarium anthophilum TaxID=48485 RepID=A0A8H4ZIQ7_9HYPO|nr:hypothetical protein FANTH_6465 [Fusarium anthophilum]